MITITGNAKITMGGQDVTEIVTDKDTVSVEGLGCKIQVCDHESDGGLYLRPEHNIIDFKVGDTLPAVNWHMCKKCGAYYR